MVKAVLATRTDVEKYADLWREKNIDAILAYYQPQVSEAPQFKMFFDAIKVNLPYVDWDCKVLETVFEGSNAFVLISSKVTCVKDGMTTPWLMAKPQDIKVMVKGDILEYEELAFFKCDPETGLIATVKGGPIRG